MMKRFALAAAAAFALTGCTLGDVASTPAPHIVAGTTALDERAALSVELSYAAFRIALETGVDAGLIRGERATRAAALDNRAFAAVGAVRAAYRAGNATSYVAAVDEALRAVNLALAAVRKEPTS